MNYTASSWDNDRTQCPWSERCRDMGEGGTSSFSQAYTAENVLCVV